MIFDPDDPTITAYIFDELEPDEKSEFEARLEQSTELQQIVERTRATVESLRADFDNSEPLELGDLHRAAVKSAVLTGFTDESASPATAPNSLKKHAATFPRKVWPRLVALGAVAAILMISAFVLIQRESTSVHTSARYGEPAIDMSSLERGNSTEENLIPFSDEQSTTYSQLSLVISQTQEVLSKEAAALGPVPAGSTRGELVQGLDRVIVHGNKSDVEHVVELIDELEDGAVEFEALAKLRTTLAAGRVEGRHLNELREIRKRLRDSPDHGGGPGAGGDKYDVIVENDFLRVKDAPLSTFSIDVDTASYSKVRIFLNQHHQLPRPDAVRIEELVNYFPYNYEPPASESQAPFAAHQAVATCPWSPNHRLVRIGIKGKEIRHEERPASNLVFLLDVSGSMDKPNKLPLLKQGMRMLTNQLSENDRVAMVVYAGAAGKVLDSTTGDHKATIVAALDRLKAGGSTNGGDGIQLAYRLALDNFIAGSTNRVILCTDGDFNVGTTGTDELVRTVEQHAKSGVFLSVLGFGMGNHNDSMLEQISNKGNGNYAFVDTEIEARKVLVEQMLATLVTIAKDVKIQVEFNPARVAAYRLIGYENRILAAQDFNDDKKDAGEIGAGHTVTALYEVVPAGEDVDTAPAVDELKYQTPLGSTEAADSEELLTLKLRYKEPDGDTSTLLTFPLKDSEQSFNNVDRDFQFAASVASFGMLLRDSKYKGNATYASVLETATAAAQNGSAGYREEFLQLVRIAAELAGGSLSEAPRE